MLKRAVLTLACLGAVAFWPGWRMAETRSGTEIDVETFLIHARDFAARHMIEGDVHPPPGPVPLLARRFEFWPPMVLQVGKTYVLQAVAEDFVHSLALNGQEFLLVPGRMTEIAFTPDHAGIVELRCNEYCGIGHSRMRGRIIAEPIAMPPAPPR